MEKLIKSVILVQVIFFSVNVQALDMSQEDKQKHMAVSGAISGPTYLTMRAKNYSRWESAAMALALSLFVGHTKETNDKKYDDKDMEANALGAVSGIMLPLSFDF